MLIPVKRFTAAKRPPGRDPRRRRAGRAGPLARRSGGRRRPPLARVRRVRRRRRGGVGGRGRGGRPVEPGAGSQRRRRRRTGHYRRQGLRPSRHRAQRHPARPRPLDRLAHAGAVTLVPDRRRDGTNVLALPVAARRRGVLRSRLVHPAPRAGDGRAVTASRSSAIPQLALDIDDPGDLAHPLAPRCRMAANDPGQPPLSVRRARLDRDCRAGVGAGRRRPSRRRRVRRRRHAGQVGGGGLRGPPPRLHRRLEGDVGPPRPTWPRSSPAARTNSARPRGGWPAAAPARSCFSGGRRRAGQRRRRSATSSG